MEENKILEIEKTLTRIEGKLDRALTDIHDHEKRLRNLEGKSGKRWESLIGTIIGLLAAAAAGYFIGGI